MALNHNKKPYSRPAPRPRGSDGEWLHDKAPGAPRTASVLTPNEASASTTTKLIISNLHYELTTKDLSQIFGQAGTLVREPLIRYDRSGRSSGVAIVSYETLSEAARGKELFNGKTAKGQPMSIEFYNPPTSAPRPGRRGAAPASLIDRIQKPALLDRLSRNDTQRQPKSSGPGPVRTKNRPAPRVPKKPKTAQELDMELDAFMGDDIKPTSAPAPAAQVDKDVEMA